MWWICPPHHCHPFKRLYVPESRGHGLHREGTGAELLQEGRALLVRLKRNRTAIYIFSGVASAPFSKRLQPSPTVSNHLQPSPTLPNHPQIISNHRQIISNHRQIISNLHQLDSGVQTGVTSDSDFYCSPLVYVNNISMSRAYDPNQRVGKFARDISRRDTISMSRAYDPNQRVGAFARDTIAPYYTP